ncbi:MAG: hypothetical protein KatS3mg121_0471 [Gammaproteobacteria bacterium]|nr:MAG: hypothetical protein KatS3mg121_0471 [Gammaproteobacteria bacterium]
MARAERHRRRGAPGRGLRLAALLLVLAAAAGFAERAVPPPTWRVALVGVADPLQRAALLETLRAHLHGRFFTADLDRVRAALEAHPWLARVELYRRWPDRLLVRVAPRRPVARFNDTLALDAQGRPFTPTALPEDLPRLAGPVDEAEAIWAKYTAWRAVLAAADLKLVGLRREARGAWTLHFADGLEAVLSDRDPEARLRRFVLAWRRLDAADRAAAARVDLRYSNGFAVRWRTDGAEPGTGV